MASLDIHIEAPPDKYWHKRRTHYDVDTERSRVRLSKSIPGRYHDGHADYDEVGVLLITWQDDDMYCKEKEVDRLRDVFKNQFRFNTETFEIPSDRSASALCLKISDFAYRYDHPKKLSIIYYGGHADFVEEKMEKHRHSQGGLQIFANQRNNDPSAFFNECIHSLNIPDADIFLVIDCCHAAQAFARQEVGKRKFELLSSTPPDKRARGPSQGSFTKAFTDLLEHLLKDFPQGFSTSKLYREIYFQQHTTLKPFLFDQSPFDFGKIWLRPMSPDEKPSLKNDPGSESRATIDLRLHMTKMPDQLMVSELAKAMQYLPYVEELQFEDLRAPDAQLAEFIVGLNKARVLKPLVAKLRRRLAVKRMKQQGIDVSPSSAPAPHKSPLNTRPRNSPLYDWSASVAEFKDGTEMRVDGSTAPALPTVPEGVEPLEKPHTLEEAKPHSFGGLFTYAFVLDVSEIRNFVATREQILFHRSFVGMHRKFFFFLSLVFLSYAITIRWARGPFV
jgi:hypothetical protein